MPVITEIVSFSKGDHLTKIVFNCTLGDGPLIRDFEINNYELLWYWSAIGFDKAYCPFVEFWDSSTEDEKSNFIYLLMTDKVNSVVCQSAMAKVYYEFNGTANKAA